MILTVLNRNLRASAMLAPDGGTGKIRIASGTSLQPPGGIVQRPPMASSVLSVPSIGR
jgi:hypothetical protein